ncbi:MAG: O-antigen translocase [Bacteroidales bacterium]|nr:O-antigen translocase [Bacteroidales bacterium]
MSQDRNSYGFILKSIGLFGGVKVFQIIVGIIKNKIVAVLLGPVGMGISGLITSTTGLVNSITGFGLQTSSVRDIAQATNSGDDEAVGKISTVLRRLVVLTGLLGAVLVFLFAKQLSVAAFSNEDYTMAFRLVSVILFFDQLSVGQNALMQGTFHYKYLAKASLYGSIAGLLVSVPLYYIWGLKAIVPVIVICSLANMLIAAFFSRKIERKKVKLSFKDTFTLGKGMLGLGIAIALAGAMTPGASYALRLFISHFGNVADVGLYAAGVTFVSSYVDVLLNAMGTDYAPRLSAVNHDDKLFFETINRQTRLLMTMIVPVIIVFLVFMKELTILLYSQKFVPITGMIGWMMAGMFFRTLSWCMSYSFVAKGASRIFFWNELLATLYNLGFSMLGYRYFGFDGMGLAFVLSYICYTVQVYLFVHFKFGFRFTQENLRMLAAKFLFLAVSVALLRVAGESVWRYVAGVALIAVSLAIAYRQMDTMVPVKPFLAELKNKFFRSNERDRDTDSDV